MVPDRFRILPFNLRYRPRTAILRFIYSAARAGVLAFRALIAGRFSGKSGKFLVHYRILHGSQRRKRLSTKIMQ